MPRWDETATLIVGGRRFDDWESVYVQDRMHESFPIFRFTAAEREAPFATLRFVPGEECAVYLGGKLAISGFILTRQVAYDANQHRVQLEGVGRTWAAARGSILDKDGNYDNHTFEQFARKLIAPFGVGVETVGQLDATPFKKLQIEKGQDLWDNLERVARPRGIIMGSNPFGKFLLIGQHSKPAVQELIEGVNIKRCQCVISIQHQRYKFVMDGQTAADDSQHGKQASEQRAEVPGTLKYYSPLLTQAEQPVWSIQELAQRANNEKKWNEGQSIEVTITVYGWHRTRGGSASSSEIWHAGEEVMVKSPMAMLNETLKIETATYTQDRESGTETTLVLKNPFALNGKGRMDFRPGVDADEWKDGAKADTTQASTPPDAPVPEPPPANLPPQESANPD